MTLPSSGTLTMSQISTEMNTTSGSLRTLSSLAGFSTPDSMSEFYGFTNYYRPNLISFTNPSVGTNYNPNITTATIYSTFAGLRAANISIQYSDNNVNWFNAGGGVMSNNSSCGITTITVNSGQFGSHRYWRYIEGSSVVAHHPRVSRITLGDNLGRSWTIVRYAPDNCADIGTFQIGTRMFDFLYAIPDMTSISSGASCNFNGISLTSGYLSIPGSGGTYGGFGNLGAFPVAGTIQFWFYPNLVQNYDNYFCTHNNGENRGIRFELNSNGTSAVVLADDNQNLSVSGSWATSANTWTNIALTWNRSTNNYKIYRNNSLIVNASNPWWPSELNNVASGIGFNFNGDRNLKGRFGIMYIYNAELTANQIQQNWITNKALYGY